MSTRSVLGAAAFSNSDAPPRANSSAEAELIARLASGDRDAFEALMRSNNRRLFRAARAVVG
ncbi:MAG TPA: hypothetical protein VLJ38_17840, partial [Polyangiaceae bacterium]|nr:hypothetical protein [Polyangiaceae bacterium]